MVGKNMLKTQLQTGITGKPSIAACAKDSGAMSFSLSHEDVCESKEENTTESKVVKTSNNKCDRGTQTELFMSAFVATLVHSRGTLEGNQQISL